MSRRTYVETFDTSAGGWFGWESNAKGPATLERQESAVVSRSPWWIDYNHAPPGAGYLHLLFALQTKSHFQLDQQICKAGGVNQFIAGGFPRNFTNARLTLRLRGELQPRGAQLLLHTQSKIGNVFVNQSLTGQPFSVTRDWSEQTVQLAADPAHWRNLGSRHDRDNFYGTGDIADVLRDLNGNIILILYPLDIRPVRQEVTDPHRLRAGEDYDVDPSALPSGYVMLDEVRIEFSSEKRDVTG